MTITRPITLRRPGPCSACQTPLERGFTAYWVPTGRRVLCIPCGQRTRSSGHASALQARDLAAAGHRTKAPED